MENVSLKIYTATSGDNFIKGFWNINSFSWSSLENSITWLLKENNFSKNRSKSNSVKICFEIPSIRLSFTVLRQHPFISKLFPMRFIFITLFISVDTEICHHRQRPKKRYEKKKVCQHGVNKKKISQLSCWHLENGFISPSDDWLHSRNKDHPYFSE